jgi:hypothetical protein
MAVARGKSKRKRWQVEEANAKHQSKGNERLSSLLKGKVTLF